MVKIVLRSVKSGEDNSWSGYLLLISGSSCSKHRLLNELVRFQTINYSGKYNN